ncbi:hypothetical protein [Paenibacillus hamazuiensis]|uniref:hypothetical protein n=1 Tax=Paenibacillus hamazuiensis TaxID=2936508 RepID=UPI00200F4CBA|nr:hypothetical protein [Paenibacillus hamazuiensis]
MRGIKMVISLHIFFTWLFAGIFLHTAKTASPRHLAFVFLFIDFLNTNLYYLAGETFKWFKMSEEPLLYVSFSLLQSLIYPLIVAIAVTAYPLAGFAAKKASVLLLSCCLLLGLELLTRYLKIITYDGTGLMIALLGYRLLLLIAAFIALKCFKRMCAGR